MAATRVVVPDIGDFDGIPVIEILVSVGQSVQAEQSLVTLESDKATMDVPAPTAGIVTSIDVALGDRVSVGSFLLELDATAGDGAQGVPASDAAAGASPGIGNAPTGQPRAAAPAATPGNASGGPLAAPGRQPASASAPLAPVPTRTRSLHASPTVRRFARTLGVELAGVVGTGPRGRILRSDVESHVKQRLAQSGPAAAARAGGGIPPVPPVDFSKFGPVAAQPLSRIKRISGPFLHRAWLNVPHVTYTDEADITELEAFRKRLEAARAGSDTRITPLAFFVKALCAALREFPTFNASLAPDGETLIVKQYFHIGVAVDTPGGLVVPVLRNVDNKGLTAIAEALSEVSARARDGRLKVDDLQGGCMTISSLGGIGGTSFTPIVNAPEVAILGITRSRMTPVWAGTRFVPRLMLPLCLSFDHRVVDGAESARFMNFLCTQLADVRTLLL